MEGGVLTPTLRHAGHMHARRPPERHDYLRGHEWIHLAMVWNAPVGAPVDERTWTLYVNGKRLEGTTPVWNAARGLISALPNWANEPFAADGRRIVNPVRFGEPSSLDGLDRGGAGGGLFDRNWVPDGTIDEFHLWADARPRNVDRALSLWRRGRYCARNGAWFRSSPLLDPSGRGDARRLPPSIPGGTEPVPAATGGTTILGVAWSWRAEDVDWRREGETWRLVPVLRDYRSEPDNGLAVTGPLLEPDVLLEIEASDKRWEVAGAGGDAFAASGYAAVLDPETKRHPVVEAALPVRYRAVVHADMKGSGQRREPREDRLAGAVFLATVVLDDVTVFLDSGGSEVLEWAWTEEDASPSS